MRDYLFSLEKRVQSGNCAVIEQAFRDGIMGVIAIVLYAILKFNINAMSTSQWLSAIETIGWVRISNLNEVVQL
jgi:hypothetical protein